MHYRIIQFEDGTTHSQYIPDSATDRLLTESEEVVLKLADELEKLKAPNNEYKPATPQSCLNCKDRDKCLKIKTNCCFWQQA